MAAALRMMLATFAGCLLLFAAVIVCVPRAHAAVVRCHGVVGVASFYGAESGTRTASGARFDPMAMTAAHRSLPFGAVLVVTAQRTGRSVRVTVTDRGPYIRGRMLDLSRGAAEQLGIIRAGTARVCVRSPP